MQTAVYTCQYKVFSENLCPFGSDYCSHLELFLRLLRINDYRSICSSIFFLKSVMMSLCSAWDHLKTILFLSNTRLAKYFEYVRLFLFWSIFSHQESTVATLSSGVKMQLLDTMARLKLQTHHPCGFPFN